MIPIYVTTVNEHHPELARRKLHELFRAMHYAIGVEWTEKLLPEHFLPSAFQALGYQQRKPRYNLIKDRMFRRGELHQGRRVIAGSETPLVLTGRLREDLLRSRNMIRAYPTRVTIDLIGPPYFTLRPRKSKTTILIAREVLAVSDRHVRLMGIAGQRAYVSTLGRLQRAGALKKVERPNAA